MDIQIHERGSQIYSGLLLNKKKKKCSHVEQGSVQWYIRGDFQPCDNESTVSTELEDTEVIPQSYSLVPVKIFAQLLNVSVLLPRKIRSIEVFSFEKRFWQRSKEKTVRQG